MWLLILFIRNFSSSLSPVFIKLIGQYLRTSLSPSLPDFSIGCIIDLFQCCGKCPFCIHSFFYVSGKGGEAPEDLKNCLAD